MRYLVTAALPYANGPLHIGHIAGCYLPSDIFVRYQRLMGRDVKFICGSDEHGVPITLRARKEGITPQQVVDKYHAMMRDSFKEFGISFDIYHRTSDPVHHETASGFFKTLYEKGVFAEEESEQYFDEEANMFLADRYITGTCPKCGNPNAYGDQCEKCGSSLSPRELINPHSQLSGKAPVLRNTKHWYLPLDKMQEEWLQEWILSKEDSWKKNVFGQCKSWLDQGLQPRAVTRDLDWGVPVPLPGNEGKVLYVWFDAPIRYISATKALTSNWEQYWKDKDTKLIHFIGKDNIVFHCIIFPAMLKAHGDYVLPENVPANEFLNLEGDKISTSRNWAVWLHEYLEDFPNKQDVLRYALCATAPETKDNDFTWKDFQDRNNNELVAVLGNFVNRTLVLTSKYFESKVPARGELLEAEKVCLEALAAAPKLVRESIEKYRFREALSHMMDLARAGNKYLADTEPWKHYKTNPVYVGTVLNVALEITTALAYLCEPFLPFTAEKLRKMMNIPTRSWEDAFQHTTLAAGHILGEASLLYEKIEDEAIQLQLQKLEATKENNIPVAAETTPEKSISPIKEVTTYDEFSKMDLRVATIIAAEKVEKADKLLKLTLDTGIDQRTVVSGIALHFSPEEIIGKQVTLLANLAPRKIKGIESNGMILMAEDADGKLVFVQPGRETKEGSTIA
ncbi:MAG: methionine--tRNA ligase [Bacteroidetes bacterium]|nr:methionine--tRNA ligase [Bacteroidota bacterium]